MGSRVNAAAVYCRISQDRNGEGLGVERQQALCRKLAADKGWPVVEVYVDNDLSAYSGKPRPAYQRLLDDLRAGRRDAVLVVDQDRLTRHPAELEGFIELADRLRIPLANVSGDVDLATSDGRFRARIMGAVARQESEKKGERLQRQREQMAAAGKPHPGPRAFGYEPGNTRVRPEEAELIRRAAADVLAGRTLRAVADDWNVRGVRTSRGKYWTVNAVRDLLCSPRNAGLRVHRGEVVGDGTWPAILDRDTHERLCGLTDKRRRKTGRPPTRLLSGVCRCALCDGPMRASSAHGRAIYACRRQPGKGDSCGRLSVVADPVDALVTDALLGRLAGPGLARALSARERNDEHRELTDQLEGDEAALEQLSRDHYVDRILGRREFLAAHEELQSRIASSRAALAATNGTEVLAGLPGGDDSLHAWWDAAPGDLRRAVVEAVIEAVVIRPANPQRRREFDAERVGVVWQA